MDFIDGAGFSLESSTYTGAISGNPNLVTGKVGKATYLDGNTYVDLGNIRYICFGLPDLCSDGYSLALWMKKPKVTTESYYISSGGQTTNSYGICVSALSSNLLYLSLKTKKKWYRTNIATQVCMFLSIYCSAHMM